VSPELFHTKLQLWADNYLLLVAAFQAGLLAPSNVSQSALIIALNVFTLAVLSGKLWLHLNKSIFRIPEEVIGSVRLSTVVEAILFSLHTTTWLAATASGYAAGTTTFALAVLSLPAVVTLILRLVASVQKKAHTSEPSAPPEDTAPSNEPSAPPEAQVRTPLPAQPMTLQLNSKVTGDALLFSRTRPLAGRLKKNS
jgi:hypothetical protein